MEDRNLEALFVKGNEAIAMAAIDAGCLLYFGYPITPQSDIPEYLSRHLPPWAESSSRQRVKSPPSTCSWAPRPPERGP